MSKKQQAARDAKVRVQYIGGHKEVVNSLTGLWKQEEIKELPIDVAEELTKHPAIFKEVKGNGE